MTTDTQTPSLEMLLRVLKLPGFAAHYEELSKKADKQGLTHKVFLRALVELEIEERRARRVERLLKASELPSEKTLATLKPEKVPPKARRQLPALCEGGFIERSIGDVQLLLTAPRCQRAEYLPDLRAARATQLPA